MFLISIFFDSLSRFGFLSYSRDYQINIYQKPIFSTINHRIKVLCSAVGGGGGGTPSCRESRFWNRGPVQVNQAFLLFDAGKLALHLEF